MRGLIAIWIYWALPAWLVRRGNKRKDDDMIQESIDLLGLRATDKISGFSGVISSVSFDLYGCVQVALSPPAKDSKLESSIWFDVERLSVESSGRVMDVPDFKAMARKPSEFLHGAADKPSPRA